MDFNIRLENLLEERNMTQKQLSMDLHIASSTVNGYVKKNRQPDFEMLIRLARYFDVTTDYLLGLTNDKKPAPSTLNSNEASLIHLYRTLIPEHQDLIYEQTKFYHNLSLDDDR